MRGDLITEQLRSQGNVIKYEIVQDDILNVKKLFKKRVQAIVTSELAAKYIAKNNSFDPDLIESQYEVATMGFNLALSRKTSGEICAKLKTSLSTLLSNGTIEKIINRWK